MRPARILHVIGRMDLGGAELRLMELIERLPADEFRIDVCVVSGLNGALDDRVRARGGAVIPLRLDAAFAPRFTSLLRDGGYHVVHSHTLLASGWFLALAALARVPVRVAHFHATVDEKPSTLLRRVRRRVAAGLLHLAATDIVACGEGAMNAMWPAWRNDSRCRVLYDAVDPERFASQRADPDVVRAEIGVSSAGPLFLHIANVSPVKNHERLLRIFSAIRTLAPAASLVLVGADTDVANGAVDRNIRELGLHGTVVPLGVRHDVPRLLAAADALLLPSLYEGLPGVVLEACVAGVPVLASDLPGVREIANQLKGVYYLSLTESDSEWARIAVALPLEATRLGLRNDALGRFRPSVFHIDRAVEAHCELWHRRGVPCA